MEPGDEEKLQTDLHYSIWGREFDWYAVDNAGHVAVFSSGGHGGVPTILLPYIVVLDGLYNQIMSLPVIGTATGHAGGNLEFWLEASKRGFFGYDKDAFRGPYQRKTTPTQMIRLFELPTEIAQIAGQIVLRYDFNVANQVDPTREFECVDFGI